MIKEIQNCYQGYWLSSTCDICGETTSHIVGIIYTDDEDDPDYELYKHVCHKCLFPYIDQKGVIKMIREAI